MQSSSSSSSSAGVLDFSKYFSMRQYSNGKTSSQITSRSLSRLAASLYEQLFTIVNQPTNDTNALVRSMKSAIEEIVKFLKEKEPSPKGNYNMDTYLLQVLLYNSYDKQLKKTISILSHLLLRCNLTDGQINEML